MRIRLRFLLAALGCVVIAPLLAWWISGSDAAERMAQRIVLTEEGDRVARERELATRLALRLESLRTAESRRPWHHYQDLHHDPASVAQGIALTPSPIARGPEDPLIAAHFSVRPGAAPWIAGRDRDRVARIAMNVLAHPPECGGPVSIIDTQAFYQNAQASVLAEAVRRGVTPTLPSRGETEIVASPLTSSAIGKGPNLALVAVRCVVVEDHASYQGYVAWRDTAQQWLRDASGTHATLRGSGSRVARVPIEGVTWSVALPDDAMPAARQRAQEVVAAFRRRFARSAAMLLATTGLVAALLLQADRFARRRVEFATAAAHELRTPLASLQLQAELLAREASDDATRDRAARLTSDAARLGRVVANVLDATRIERGGSMARAEPGDLASAARAIVQAQAPLLESMGMRLRFDADPSLPPALFDAEALAHVIGNLLDNAERHSRRSESRSVSVEVRAGPPGAQLVIVTNTGPVIAPSQRDAIFRRFTRRSASRAGLGLGLSLARSLARAQGGDLTCDACDGGARFVVTVRKA